jgi:hypothetical protein
MRVTEVDPSSDHRWEEYVTAHPQGLIYHRAAWLHLLAGDYGGGSVNLLCEADGDVLGILPLCATRRVPLGIGGAAGRARLVSLPRSPIAGPLISHDDAAIALVRAALATSRAEGLRLQIKPPPGVTTVLDTLLGAVRGDTSYVLDLPAAGAELRFGNSRNHGAIRRAVAKAAKSGVEVRAAQDERDLRAWYPLYLEAMRRHVAPPRPYRFFRRMWQILKPPGMMELLLAEQQPARQTRHLLAGSIFLMSNQTVVFAFNGRREQELGVRPNDALHWHAIREAQRRGFRRYDFGDVDDANPGLAQFKLKWGAVPQRLYQYHDPPIEESPARTANIAAPATRIARASWQKLPLTVTARVGDVLYRYI